jgi:hypothetical protein
MRYGGKQWQTDMCYITSNEGSHESSIQRHGQDTWLLSPKIETEVSTEE